MVVRFQPVVEMNLIQVRAHEFFSQFVRLAADERHLQTREGRDGELRHPIGIKVRMGVTGLHLAQRARDHQQPMRIVSHQP